jgi:large repetitive protein
VQPGTYSGTVVSFAGNDRYAPALPLVLTQTVTGGVNHSVAFNGTNGYAEATDAPDVNLTGDRTVELWFKDENPNGFNHDYVTLINKGDRSDNAESPYFITLGFKQLLVGQRRDWTDYAVSYDLLAAGVNPKQWHHLAATFTARTRTLVLYLDGVQVAQDKLGASSIGNTAPVEIGRNGPVSGKYFRGKLDDVRLWNVARTASQIAASFAQELTSPPTTLVANWKFNERLGTLAAYSSVGTHTAILSTTGAAFSTDVHP